MSVFTGVQAVIEGLLLLTWVAPVLLLAALSYIPE
jgi:hypothetical protein